MSRVADAPIKLKLPPGVYRNGTEYQSMGRWYDADLVRWIEGAMQPVGGWQKIQESAGGPDTTIEESASGQIFEDRFQRAAGNTIGNSWTEHEDAAADLQLYDVGSGKIAVLKHSAGETDGITRNSPAIPDADFVLQCTVSLSANAAGGIWVGESTWESDGYYIVVNHNTSKITLGKDGTGTLQEVAYSPGVDNWTLLRVRVIVSAGTSVRFIVYAAQGTGQDDLTTDVVATGIDYTDSSSPYDSLAYYGTSMGWWGCYIDDYEMFSGHQIVISNVPTGWKAKVDSRSAVTESSGTITIDASLYGKGTTVSLLDADDTVIDTVSPSAGVWPGDTYSCVADPADIGVAEPIRGMLAWLSNGGKSWLAFGTPTLAYSFSEGVLSDITPGGFTTGAADAAITVGNYGAGNYGAFAYGEGDPSQGTLVEANSWQFDSWGQNLIGWAYSDGKIYEYTLSGDFAAVSNAPTSVKGGIVVTDERILMALGASGDPRLIAWSDQEDNTEWTGDGGVTNQAGDFPLSTPGEILCGTRGRKETLIWTTTELWSARYVGGAGIYAFKAAGQKCGIISRMAYALTSGKAYWMGQRGFFVYDGFVDDINCDVSDYVFNDMNRTQKSKICAVALSDFNEVGWFYPSAGSTENDRGVFYNYDEGIWTLWNLERTAGVDRDAFQYPILADAQGGVYDHERGNAYVDVDDSTPLTPNAETGPFEVGKGGRNILISEVWGDEKTVGDVTVTIFARPYPGGTESSQAVTLSSGASDARLEGRQIRVKISQSSVNWRLGDLRLKWAPAGMR
jgi:hypothetical protein